MSVIAVDIDDVLIPFYQSLADWHNRQNGTDHHMDHLPTTRLSDGWGGEEVYWIEQCNTYHQDALSGSSTIPIFPEAKQSLLELKNRGHRLILVTSRPVLHRDLTQRWVDANLDGIVDDLHMSQTFSTVEATLNMKKGELCKYLGATVLIDDSPHYIQSAVEHGVLGILFGDYSWNRTTDHTHRAHTWADAVGLIQQHAGEPQVA